MDKSVAAHVSALVVVALLATVGAGASKGLKKSGDHHHRLVTTKRALVDLCGWTDYQQQCADSLAHAKTSNPVELVKMGFNVAKLQIQSALANSTTIQAAANDPETAGALDMCRQLMSYAVKDIETSLDSLSRYQEFRVGELVEDVKTWLNAAITYQETCLDGFETTKGQSGECMRKLLNSSMDLTSNALAMADGVSSFLAIPEVSAALSSFNFSALNISDMDFSALLGKRRLLSTPEERRLSRWTGIERRGLLDAKEVKADAVVAKDGSGQFKTINDALKGVPPNRGNKTYVIRIKAGVYEEQVTVGEEMKNIMFVGDGPTKTKITGKKNHADGLTVLKTATVGVLGNGFTAKDIGFENAADSRKGEAVALWARSDGSIFQNCQIDGYTNTLFALTYRQFYRDCTISGAKNIIAGNAVVVFQNCNVVIRRPDPKPSGDPKDSHCFVTCQTRNEKRGNSGFVFQNCTIVAAPDYLPVRKIAKSYLGHPKKQLSRVVFMQSQINDIIEADGWAPWSGSVGLDTCFFAEYQNRGPGACQKGRVKWPGIQHLDPTQVMEFTADKFIGGQEWVKSSGVPYVGGMMNI